MLCMNEALMINHMHVHAVTRARHRGYAQDYYSIPIYLSYQNTTYANKAILCNHDNT